MGVAEVINIKSNNLNLIMAVNSKWSREIVALQNHLSNIEENCSLTNYTAFVTAVKKAHDESPITPIQTELDELHTLKRTFQSYYDKLCTILSKQKDVTDQIEAVAMPSDKEKCDMKLNKLFRECSGIEFQVTDGNAVSMVFTIIDPVNPHQEFSVTLDVQEYTKTWKLIAVKPHIEGLQTLIDKLNQTNDLHQFALEVRTTFKNSLSKSASIN